jgi:hypothetical protein
MPSAIEQRLDMLINEIAEIKKSIILDKFHKVNEVTWKKNNWKSLTWISLFEKSYFLFSRCSMQRERDCLSILSRPN